MRLPRFDVVFGLAASAVDIFIKTAGVAGFEIGDDEARVDAVGPGFHSGDDALDPTPALRAVEEFLIAPRFAGRRSRFERGFGSGLEAKDMRSQRRRRSDAEDEVADIGAAEVDRVGRAIRLFDQSASGAATMMSKALSPSISAAMTIGIATSV